MSMLIRIPTMITPTTGEVREVYTGHDTVKTLPKVGTEVLVVDVSGSGKKFDAAVVSLDSKRHTYKILVGHEREDVLETQPAFRVEALHEKG